MPAPKPKQRRYHKGKTHCNTVAPSEDDSVIVQAFQQFGKELDAKHDKYERIVKLSRDITIESKRLIFGLHALNRSSDPEVDYIRILNGLQKLLGYQFKAIALELEGEDPYQFMKAYSAGLQEYIEAVTLYHYLRSSVLYNWEQLKNDLKFEFDVYDKQLNISGAEDSVKELPEAQIIGTKNLTALLPLSEYILGVQDLSGELMRLCISSFATGKVDIGFTTCNFSKMLYIGMLHLGSTPIKEFWRKQYVFKQSLYKMETACYMMHVRGSEILRDTFTVAIEESGEEDYSSDFF